MIKLFECYPFRNLGVKIAEGFAAYDGNLRHMPGRAHCAVDYVLRKSEEVVSFEVYNMYEGHLGFGVSQSWGKYFVVSRLVGEYRYNTIYAHLDYIPEEL